MAKLPLTGNYFQKSGMEYYGKFGHTLRRMQHIDLMSIIYICYANFLLATKTVAMTFPGFQVIKICAQYLASQPHKPIFILLTIMMAQISSDLHGVGIKLNNTLPIIF